MSRDASDPRYREIWVEGPQGQQLCALIHGEVGWLMYLREPGDTGMSSRNPDYDGPAMATIDYVLDNGQRDEYPAGWALPIETLDAAIEAFRADGQPPAFIQWHRDE